MAEGVYEVERVVERRRRVSIIYFKAAAAMFLHACLSGESRVFGVVGWVQAGGGILGGREGGDCCSIEVCRFNVL